jgi:hypothetical protein
MAARSGVRFVLSRSADPACEAEFNRWYDGYIVETIEPGHLINGGRYVDVARDPTGERAPYVAVYDIVMGDPGRAWPLTTEHFGADAAHMLSPLLVVPYRATYATLATTRDGYAVDPAGLAVTLSDPAPGVSRDEAAHWLRAALGDAATLLEIVDGSPDPPRFLELRDLAAPPAVPVADVGDRRAAVLRTRLSGTYRRISWSAR